MERVKHQLEIDGSPGYHLVQDREELKELAKRIRDAEYVFFDYETYELTNDWWESQIPDQKKRGIDFVNTFLTGVSFAFDRNAGEAWYVPVEHAKPTINFSYQDVRYLLEQIKPTTNVVAHNMFYEYMITKQCLQMDVPGILWDTMIMAFTINENQYVGLKGLVKKEIGVVAPTYEQVTGGKPMNLLTGSQVRVYGCADSDDTLQLFWIFKGQLESMGLYEYVQALDMQMIPVLVAMFMDGAPFDDLEWSKQNDEATTRSAELLKEITDIVGYEINLASPKQLSHYLYDVLELPCTVFTDTGGKSTNATAMANLRVSHPIVAKLVEYRQLEKRRSSFYEAYPKFRHPETGKLHAQVSLIATDEKAINTGRLAGSKPNLMQIPKRGSGRVVRKMFIPHRDLGHDLIYAADWSQIELRILAYFARPALFLEAYVSGKEDLHTKTGKRIFADGLTKMLRDIVAKPTNFLIIYGGGASKLRDTINKGAAQAGLDYRVTERECQAFIDGYYSIYPEVEAYQFSQKKFAQKHGYVESMFGRRYHLPFINSRNRELRQKAERKTVNSVIQGSAAELMKLSMTRIWKDERFRIMYDGGLVRIIQPIHDELVFSLNSVILRQLHDVVYPAMVTPPDGFDIPLDSEAKVGPNFADTVDLNKWLEEHDAA